MSIFFVSQTCFCC